MSNVEEAQRQQIRLYETVIDSVCEALGITPSGCSIVELDEMIRERLNPTKPIKQPRPAWDTYFMIIADAVSLRMSCDRARVGAVIVVDKRIMSTGYGGAPSGLPSCDEVGHELVDINGRQSCVRTIHAEKNAIITAARYGVRLANSTLYTTASPCRDCFMAALQTGIVRIVYGSEYIGGKAFDFVTAAHQNGIALTHLPIAEAIKNWTPPPHAVSVKP